MSEETTTTKDAIVEEGVPDITLSTGVVLRPKPVPPGVYIRISTKDPMPKPPKFKVPGKDVYLDNTDDETFIKDVKDWDAQQNKRLLFAMVVYGIDKIVEIPKGMKGPKSDGWIDMMRLTDGEVFPENPTWRQAAWILEVAALTADDFTEIFTGVGRLTGVPEEDVQSAAQFS